MFRWSVAILCVFLSRTLFADGCENNFAGTSDPSALSARILGSLVSEDKAEEHLEFLTGKKPIIFSHRIGDRKSSANKEIARLYLVSYLQRLGLEVRLEYFEEGINFVAEIPGTENPDEVFEVAAHYDTEDDRVPGADDNGSGLTTLLEMARIFSTHRPKKTLRITLLDLEETGAKGSKFHVKQIYKEFYETKERKFLGTLIVDMIGYNPSSGEQKVVLEVGQEEDYKPGLVYSWERDKEPSPAGDSQQAYALSLTCATDACYQFLRFAKDKRRDERLHLTVAVETAMPSSGDHGSYWQKGLPALFLAAPYNSPYINPQNHRPGDNIDNMNWEYFMSVMELAVEMTARTIGATPNDDDPAVKKARQLLSAQENTTVVHSGELIQQLTVQKPPPSYLSGSSTISSKAVDFTEEIFESAYTHARSYLILEKNLDRADVGYLRGNGDLEQVYVANEATVKELIKMFAEKKRPILVKDEKGYNSNTDIRMIAKWYMEEVAGQNAKANGKLDIPPPSGYTYFLKKRMKKSFWLGIMVEDTSPSDSADD